MPDAEQRRWRTLTRTQPPLIRGRARWQNQLEALLKTDPEQLAELGDERLQCRKRELAGALRGAPAPVHLEAGCKLLDQQIRKLDLLVASN